MKFASYQRVVTPNTINPPAYKAPSDLQVYGTGGKEFDSLGGALGQMNKIALKIQDDQDSSALMDARNKIMTRLTDGLYGEEGLFTTGVGENAAGLSERTHDFIKETFDDVMSEGRYNGRVRRALESNLNDNFNNYHRIAASQETRERQGVDNANYDGALSLEVQNAGLTWNVNGSLTNTLKNIETLAYAHGSKYGTPGLKIQSDIRKWQTQAVQTAYNQAIAEGDYARAEEITSNMRKYIDPNTYAQMRSTTKKHEDIKSVNDDAQSIIDACYDPKTGKFDSEKARQMAREKATRSVGGGNMSGTGKSNQHLWQIAVKTAKRIQEKYGVNANPNYLYGQMMHETGNGTDPTALQNHNYAGLHGGAAGMAYEDDDKYVEDYASFYAGPERGKAVSAATPEEYVQGLKDTNWMEDSTGGYLASVKQYSAEGESSGSSWSPSSTIYYQVAPGKEGEVEGLQHNTWMKLQALAAKFQERFGGEKDFEPFYVTAASAQSGHNTDSWHYYGQAFDIAMDSLKRHPERLEWLQEHAKDVGLVPLNEYNGYGNEQWADGENFHFSDHGEPFDESSMQGTGGGSSGHMEYQPEYESKLLSQVKALLADKQRTYKQQHQDYLDNLGTAIQNAGGYANAKTVIEQADLTLQERNSLMSQARSYYGVSVTGKPIGSSRSSGSSSSGGVSASKAQSALSSLETLSVNLQNGNSIGTSAFLSARRAGNLLDDNGLLSDDDARDVRNAYSNQEFMSNFTDDIEQHGLAGAYNNLIASGMSPIAAAITITKADTHYLQKNYQGEYEDEEG